MINKNVQALEQKYSCVVPEKRIKVWDVQLKLWRKFDAICKKHGLRYFSFWGALLGAVRHQGFIPWDDDIDVVMPREDYNKFAEVALVEIEKPYFLLTKDTAGESIYWFMKLIDESTTCIWNRSLDPTVHHQGLSLDIVPLDGVPQGRIKRFWQFVRQKIDFSLMNKAVTDSKMLSFKGKMIKFVGKIYCSTKTRRECIERTEMIRATYQWNESNTITEAAHNFRFNIEDFQDTVYLEFEGYQIPAPAGYDNILKTLYKNYMDLPPVKQRIIPEDEAAGWIVEPTVSYQDYFEIMQNRIRAIEQEKRKSFHAYCD